MRLKPFCFSGKYIRCLDYDIRRENCKTCHCGDNAMVTESIREIKETMILNEIWREKQKQKEILLDGYMKQLRYFCKSYEEITGTNIIFVPEAEEILDEAEEEN